MIGTVQWTITASPAMTDCGFIRRCRSTRALAGTHRSRCAATMPPSWSRRPAPARRRACRWSSRGEAWAKDRRILVLEPRRLAARAAAERMAKTLGERVGETVGLRVRFGSEISRKHPHRDHHRRHFHPADPRRSDARRRRRGAFRRIPRALARRRSRPGAGARRAAGLARGFAAPGHVGDHRRRARRKLARRRAGDRKRRPRLSGRDPLCRPRRAADRAADRRHHRAGDARGHRLAAGLPARAPPKSAAPEAQLEGRPDAVDRRRRALWRARRRRAGPRHRAGTARPPQDRAGDLDCRNLDHHRRRAHRRRLRARARAALRA